MTPLVRAAATASLSYKSRIAPTTLKRIESDIMSSIDIQRLTPESIAPAARLLAGSMLDNPLHRRIFGDDEAQLTRLLMSAFARLLQRQLRSGLVLGAFDGTTLVGVAAMVPSGQCQPTLHEKLNMLAILARERQLRRVRNIARWLRIWNSQDPSADHWHLGPAAIARERQGQGIGSALMAAICAELDRRQAVGYLETDKERNVALYRRGGFEVVAERPVLGVTNWFMLRQPLFGAGTERDDKPGRNTSTASSVRPPRDLECVGAHCLEQIT